jgi:hypothetical protein
MIAKQIKNITFSKLRILGLVWHPFSMKKVRYFLILFVALSIFFLVLKEGIKVHPKESFTPKKIQERCR